MMHILGYALLAITIGLRAATAVITFTVALNRARGYWQRSSGR